MLIMYNYLLLSVGSEVKVLNFIIVMKQNKIVPWWYRIFFILNVIIIYGTTYQTLLYFNISITIF